MAAVQTHLIVFNQEVSGHVEDHCVESIRVQGQSVVIVKAVDVHLGQTHFIVGVNSGGVEEVAGARRNQFWWETMLSMKKVKQGFNQTDVKG